MPDGWEQIGDYIENVNPNFIFSIDVYEYPHPDGGSLFVARTDTEDLPEYLATYDLGHLMIDLASVCINGDGEE